MTILTKNKLSLLAVYLGLVLISGIVLEQLIHNTVRDMMGNTAKLLAQEMRAMLHEPIVSYLNQPDQKIPLSLQDILIEAQQRSETLISIDLLRPKGDVAASSNTAHIGEYAKIPRHLFAVNQDPQLTSDSDSMIDMDTHLLWMPVVQEGKTLGYLRMLLQGQDMAKVFHPIYILLLVAVAIGLISIIFLDLSLHVELDRITKGLAMLLEAAIQGDVEEAPADQDEFGAVRKRVTTLGKEIRKTRTQVDRVRSELTTVANHLKVGVIFIDKDSHIEFVSDQAKLHLSPTEQIESYVGHLEEILEKLQPAIETLRTTDKLTGKVSFSLGKEDAVKHLQAELYRLNYQQWQGCAVLLHDQDFLDSLNDNLENAARCRSLSVLLLGAIHDIRAPINAMIMNLELLSESLEGNGHPPSAEAMTVKEKNQLRYVGVLKSELERLNLLISGLYAQTLGGDESKTEGELGSLVEDFCHLLRPQARSQKVNLKFNKSVYPVSFYGFPGQIKQAVLNLMINALEAMPNGGDLVLTLGKNGHEGCLQVCDTGPGIPSSLKNQIFNLHFTTKKKGTGIGLYVTRSIIEKHGGRISVKSEPGKGTCFEITLPLVPEN